ncbi:arrestin domain-containing protein 3-like [Larimichthys crocea]|uniref:arrestin domain-containing protein 3-like n=1 Tax=Larimichthys crocea TaxID=215358 RepID=UPI000F5DDE2D|nr:arrestin domain-containing protein 3-like [Larimichthys crocea]
MTITNFSLEYDAINSNNTFTNGDIINGRIILELSKETRINSLVFTAKGEARVRWTEHHGNHHAHHAHHAHHVHHAHHAHHHHAQHQTYWSEEKYYDVTQHILKETRQDGTEVIGGGRHVFPFSFQIPDRKIPSTIKTPVGKIVHKMKAELKQPMKLTKKAKAHFTFVSKADMDIPGLMEPQHGCKNKSVKVFASGNVLMDVYTKRMGYKQGEDIQVTVEISNRSTRSVKPKFVLYEKKSHFAQGRRKLFTNDILKEKVEDVPPSDKETVTKVITIPKELQPSILNCSIIKVEYRLKVYLDIKYATDPEVKLPIVILPAYGAPAMNQAPPPANYGFQAFGYPNQTPWNMAPQQQAVPQHVGPPPAYGAYAMYPSFPASDKYSDAL